MPMREGDIRPPSGRLPGIEGLRALAAFSLVGYHTWLYSGPTGSLDLGPLKRVFLHLAAGVTLFFTLSGFLLYGPFAEAMLHRSAWPSLATYFKNRALRIIPAYWVILLLVSTVHGSALTRDAAGNLQNGWLYDPGL